MNVVGVMANTVVRCYRETRAEPYEPPVRELVGEWSARITGGGARALEAGGASTRTQIDAVVNLPTDAAPVVRPDCVLEDADGNVWNVTWSTYPTGLGLSRVRCGVRLVEGTAA